MRSCPTTDACCKPPSISHPSGGRPAGPPSDPLLPTVSILQPLSPRPCLTALRYHWLSPSCSRQHSSSSSQRPEISQRDTHYFKLSSIVWLPHSSSLHGLLKERVQPSAKLIVFPVCMFSRLHLHFVYFLELSCWLRAVFVWIWWWTVFFFFSVKTTNDCNIFINSFH